jgi:hypothetical protein
MGDALESKRLACRPGLDICGGFAFQSDFATPKKKKV